MFGFRIIPSSFTHCEYSSRKTVCRTLGYFGAQCQSVISLHQDLRFDDRNEACLLTQPGIASQRVCVRFDAPAAGNTITNGKDRSPLGETCAHLQILR